MNDNVDKVCIVGLGWLGLPLALSLLSKNYVLSGTVSTQQKREALSKTFKQKIDIHTFQLYQQAEANKGLSNESLQNATLVLNIPPGRQQFKAQPYIDAMLQLAQNAFANGLKQLIFISTTSVFNGHSGVISNNSERLPTTESGKAHKSIEDALLRDYGSKVCILRPSGLIGENIGLDGKATGYRHPVYSLSKKVDIENGCDPVNLVHQADVIAVIEQVIKHNVGNSAYNIAALEHPSRRDYYTWCAEQLKIQKPQFLDKETQAKNTENIKRQVVKTIDASHTFKELGIAPLFKSPYDMLLKT